MNATAQVAYLEGSGFEAPHNYQRIINMVEVEKRKGEFYSDQRDLN